MKRWLITMCFVVLVPYAASAQHKKDVPPQVTPTDNGPSLEVTAKFIQDKLAEQGVFHYISYVHNNQTGEDNSVPFSFEVTGLEVDAANCKLVSNYRIPFGNAGEMKGNQVFSLRSIKQIQVIPASNWWTQQLADEGHPMDTSRVEPSFFMLSFGLKTPTVSWTDRLPTTWSFHEEDTANRVAKAMVHAVELCGGGSETEPF